MTAGAAIAIPLVAGQVISALLNQACIRAFGGAMQLSPGGQWEECHFTQQTVKQWQPVQDGVFNFEDAGTWYPTQDSACAKAADNITKYRAFQQAQTHGTATQVYAYTGPNGTTGCFGTDTTTFNDGSKTVSNTSWAVSSQSTTQNVQDGWVPATQTQAEQAIESKLSDWATSDLTRGNYNATNTLQEALSELYEAGQPVDGTVQAPDVQTPVMSSPTVSTTTGSDGKAVNTTTQTENDYSCTVVQDGKAVQCSQTQKQTTTSTTTDPSSSTTTTSTTVVTTNPDKPTSQDDVSFNDTPLPAKPTLYTKKYPDGMTGVWEAKKTALMNSPLLGLVHSLMPNIGDGGTCPSWTVDLNLGLGNFGTGDVSVPCSLWPVLKIIVICSALLLARALIFGG
jgi:hypothetical protein